MELATELAAKCERGDRRSASRLISLLESGDRAIAHAASAAVSRLPLPRQTIGITGPPGAGKSTLIDYLVSLYRARQEKIAVLAIDPSSPFTGGALLGDRIRMASSRNDSDVFIRSMGNRGASGGLAAAASDTLRVLGASGHAIVLLETIGAGQAETEIVNLADTVCLVQVPGLGDDVQLMKMGALEIADIFIVNKGDKPGADELKLQLEMAVQDNTEKSSRVLRQLGREFAAAYKGPPWQAPVLVLSAVQRQGGPALLEACDRHAQFLDQPALSHALKRSRLQRELLWRAGMSFQDLLQQQLAPNGSRAGLIDDCLSGKQTLGQAVARIVGEIAGGQP